ncbi:MAG: Branched-chain amino acid ABC-type transport system, permease component [Deltaproteobacteria bacterium]|jgi:branched-chain amino acid transport system permease protein|nr:Branched-chain amino acid ABC-type transport system, permease component [Deltaproteobacteria bacterium]
MRETLQVVLIYAFVLGSIYLLISLGFSIICGVLRIFHLGYAYLFTLTVYLAWMFMKELGFGLIPALLGMVVIQFVISYIIYKGIIMKFVAQEEIILTGLLLVSIVVEQAVNYRYPIQAGVFINTTLIEGSTEFGTAVISNQLLAAAAIAILLTVLFILFFLKTRIGLAIRALSQDIYSSRLIGIHVEALYTLTMFLILIPVIIGTLMVAPVWAVDPTMGSLYMTTAILVAILGGLGNIKGTIIASFLIGFTHSFVSFVLGEPRFMNFSALLLVMIILMVRPQGIAKSEALW